jgi:hypothetical protein
MYLLLLTHSTLLQNSCLNTIDILDADISSIGTIFSATNLVCKLQVGLKRSIHPQYFSTNLPNDIYVELTIVCYSNFFASILYGGWLQVLGQDYTHLMYNLVFEEGVVDDATSIVYFE